MRLLEGDEQVVTRHLQALARVHEAGRAHAWSPLEMGPRFSQLAQHVVAFRAEVLALDERYKLGQDERDDVLADILAGLDAAGALALGAWMRRFNPGRGPRSTVIDPAGADGPQAPA